MKKPTKEQTEQFGHNFHKLHDDFSLLTKIADDDPIFAGALFATCCNCAARTALHLCQGDFEKVAQMISDGINLSLKITKTAVDIYEARYGPARNKRK